MWRKPVTSQPAARVISPEAAWTTHAHERYGTPASDVIIPGLSARENSPRDARNVELFTREKSPQHQVSRESGFESLDDLKSVIIEQCLSHDLKGGCGVGNTYSVKTKDGVNLFYAVEESNCLCRWLCGPNRMMRISVYDLEDRLVMTLERSCCRCDIFCCFDCCCCQNKIQIRDVNGEVIGAARQRFHVFNLRMDILDENGAVINKLRGPCCACRCCMEINIDILNHTGSRETGYIFKRYKGHKGKLNTDHEHVEVHFPPGLTAQQKANVIGTVFLVNAMYFEMS